MKREKGKLTTFVLVVMIAIFGFSSFNQVSAQTKRQFSFDTKAKTAYTIENNQDLSIYINNIGRYDAVSVEAQPNANKVIEIRGWDVFYDTFIASSSGNVAASQIQRIATLTQQSIQFKNNTLVINNSLESNKRSAIHLLLPTGVKAKIYINGEVFQSGTLSNSAMLQGSKMVSGANGYSPRAAILQVMSREAAGDETVLRKVDAQTLRKLATKVVEPSRMDDKGQRWSAVQVTVNQEGFVTSVFYVAGDEKLASIASSKLKQFSFQPFLVDDKPIIVTSLVGVSSSNGEITLFSQIPK